MQQVPLPNGGTLQSGSHVTGHVVSVSRPKGSNSQIVVQFDQLQDEHQSIPLHVSLRAWRVRKMSFRRACPSIRHPPTSRRMNGSPSRSVVTWYFADEGTSPPTGAKSACGRAEAFWDVCRSPATVRQPATIRNRLYGSSPLPHVESTALSTLNSSSPAPRLRLTRSPSVPRKISIYEAKRRLLVTNAPAAADQK